MNGLGPLPLTPEFHEKPWGRRSLLPFFADRAELTGEAWFTCEENRVGCGFFAGTSIGELADSLGPRLMGRDHRPQSLRRRSADKPRADAPCKPPPYFPVLSKLLFVDEKLSVQVHPDDTYGLAHEDGPGKTEMWYVAEARAGAKVALGLTKVMSGEELADAARSGQIEKYLNWVPVRQGDVIFVEPGLLHTIGPGVTICEIQQNSDLTYRFYDFGRVDAAGKPRPLHVDKAVAVIRQEPWPGFIRGESLEEDGWRRERLVCCPYFAVERVEWGAHKFELDGGRFELLIVLAGCGSIGEIPYWPGSAFLIPAAAEPFELVARAPSVALRAYEPRPGEEALFPRPRCD